MAKQELVLEKPIMNAAGTLGFAPDSNSAVDIRKLGAFVTNPISYSPRKPARGERLCTFTGGFLLHTGLPNPGLAATLRIYQHRWAISPVPIIVHLIAEEPSELAMMVERLEGVEGVYGLEIGLPPDGSPMQVKEYCQAAVGELPVIIRLPWESAHMLIQTLDKEMIYAVSLAAPRGSLPNSHGDLFTGRLYGGSLFPQACLAVKRLTSFGIPVIGGGGIYEIDAVRVMLDAGAIAVQLDSVLWKNPRILETMDANLKKGDEVDIKNG